MRAADGARHRVLATAGRGARTARRGAQAAVRGTQAASMRGARTAGRGAQAAALGTRAASMRGARGAGRGARAAMRGTRWGVAQLADQVLAKAPRLPVRSQATLRAQFPGRSPDEVAHALVEGATRMAAAAGAAAGTWAAVPFLPGYPAEVAAETMAVVGIEIKLIAELHEVYGMRAPGSVVDRMTAYVDAWVHRRGIAIGPAGVVYALGSPLRRRLQRRLSARVGRSAVSLGPLMTGAAAAAMINRWETRRLGQQVAGDLRGRSAQPIRWPD